MNAAPPPGFREVPTAPSGFIEVPTTAATAAPSQPDRRGVVSGAALETVGLGTRPGARTVLDVLTRPRGVPEHLAQFAVEAPLVTIASALAPQVAIPAWAGRIGMAAGLGAGKRALRGESAEIPMGAAMDVAASALPEAGLGLVSRGLRGGTLPILKTAVGGQAAAAHEWATQAPKDALTALRPRLRSARVFIPSVDSTKKITLSEAVDALSRREGPAYVVTRSEIINWMNLLDKARGMLPGSTGTAGTLFGEMTSPTRFAPSAMSKVALGLSRGVGAPTTRAAADVAATRDVGGVPIGLPAAVLAGPALWQMISGGARAVPGYAR